MRLMIAFGLAVGAAWGTTGGHASAVTAVVAAYEMDEPPGSTVMTDAGPYGLDGVVGSDVVTGAGYDGATGYRWPWALPAQPPAKPGRIVNVDSNPMLNPDNEDYAVEFRYRTTQNFGNVVQKGQNGTPGGYYKFEQPNGLMTCLFKDVNGRRRAVTSPMATNDGAWHVIRCELSTWGVRLFVDGINVRSASANLASISNTRPLSIGGKTDCDQVKITCDYFTGDIDYVRIEKSGATTPPPTTPPPTTPPPTTAPPTTAPPTTAPAVGCAVERSDGSATLTWNPLGGTDVVRRNGTWLATVARNTGMYVDNAAPAGASYIIRAWTGSGSVDIACTG